MRVPLAARPEGTRPAGQPWEGEAIGKGSAFTLKQKDHVILILYLLINNSLEKVLRLPKEALRPGEQQVQQLNSIQKALAGPTAGT